jgi:hypothetical protein
VKLSIRLPPTIDPSQALESLKVKLTSNVPYGAQVELSNSFSMKGWNAPPNKQYLTDYVEQASMQFFGKKAMGYGMGGSIPLMGLLQSVYPKS